MKYIKPELNIERFDIKENITEDFLSGAENMPPWFDVDDENIGNIGGELFENAFNNILGI